jgi:hypothetical protein
MHSLGSPEVGNEQLKKESIDVSGDIKKKQGSSMSVG